jgi:hypothetical protein
MASLSDVVAVHLGNLAAAPVGRAAAGELIGHPESAPSATGDAMTEGAG